MGKKTYLSQQIRLISLATYDLFTDEEFDKYEQIIGLINAINKEEADSKKDKTKDPTVRQQLIDQKRQAQKELETLIASHAGTPRAVRLKSVLDSRLLDEDENGNTVWPNGIVWSKLRNSRKIAEFASNESRAMGLKDKEITYDKVIIKWKSQDILQQIVLDGFYLPVEHPDGTVEQKKFQFMTASAGQLRTDKIQCVSSEAYEKIKKSMLCGLTEEEINRRGGINVNKLLAYIALNSSASDPWTEMDIDRCIVIDDFETAVTGLSDYINEHYEVDRGIHTTSIKHTDGCGMVDPSVMRRNSMVRGPWIKGLLSPFDFLRFCKEHDVEPIIEDVYHVKHNLVKENIQVIFTKSMFKLWNYYDNWDAYKKAFKENHCTLNRTNYEEAYIPDTELNYQMIQTLNMTDDEIKQLTDKTYNRILNIAKDQESMLQALQANSFSLDPFRRCLRLYPELLRDSYTKETLKAIKKRWVLDAKSGRIRCHNKRLFAIPDFYAACEYWFLGDKDPKGLLQDGEIACRPYKDMEKADCLRSPHLAFEHCVRKIVNNEEIEKWFITNGLYTSCHDMISKVLAFDVDGDQINVVVDPIIIQAAERTAIEYDFAPLLFDLGKAGSAPISNEEYYHGLKRAHDYSGIGQVSNNLTKLWNKDKPDLLVTKWLSFYNNLVIDAAKTGFVNGFENYPDKLKRLNKATGGQNGRMPYFFQFSKNARSQNETTKDKKNKYCAANHSTMNRLCKRFDSIGIMKLYFKDIPPFNWQMLLADNDEPYNQEAVVCFNELSAGNMSNAIESRAYFDLQDKTQAYGMDILEDAVIQELTKLCGSLEAAYPSIVKYLFAGNTGNRISGKQLFWRVFGNIAYNNLLKNLAECDICENCGMKLPPWVEGHTCPKDAAGFFSCVDCGTWCERINSRQVRCPECQTAYRNINKLKAQYKYLKTHRLPKTKKVVEPAA